MNQTNEAKLLLELFNSSRNNNNNNTSQNPSDQGSASLPTLNISHNNDPVPTASIPNTTQEDLTFLKLANEVIQSTNLKSKIDPTISKLLERAQYYASPHGGLPINNLIYQNQNTFPDLSLNEFTPKLDLSPQDPSRLLSSEERIFVCDKCSLSFRRASDLKRHSKTHLEVLPNVCKLCHKGFARKDALKRHIETLTCRRNRERILESLNIRSKEEEKDLDLDQVLARNGINNL